MSAAQVFSICNSIATVGWVLLVATPPKHWVSRRLAARAIPLLLSVVYLLVLATHAGEAKGGFGSLDGVASLFSNPWILTAGWVHYLAFDLFTGSWEVQDAATRGISRWAIAPCLALTFLFGPVGLLSYFGLRGLMGRRG